MEELFKNPHDALMFAFNYSSQQYALSPMAKLMKTGIGSGKGLVALDGAAQSGIILARVEQLTALQRACIVARYAPRYEECKCCDNKEKMTDIYREAMATLSEWAIGQYTGMTLRNLRVAIVRSFFERGVSVIDTAKKLNVSKNKAYDQKARIHKALKDLDGAAQSAAAHLIEGMCSAPDEDFSCRGNTCPV